MPEGAAVTVSRLAPASSARALTGWLLLAALVVLLDRLSKEAVLDILKFTQVIEFTGFFNLVLAFNSGAAFSFLADAGGWQRWFFSAVAVLAALVMLWLLHRHATERLFAFSLSMLLGGAIGNLWDRLLWGHVVDFLQFHAMGWYFPAFNLADSAITLGAGLLMLDAFRQSRADPRSAPADG